MLYRERPEGMMAVADAGVVPKVATKEAEMTVVMMAVGTRGEAMVEGVREAAMEAVA